jgi:hypothetical protein
MGNSILILIAGSILIFGVVNVNTYKHLNSATGSAIDYYLDVQARNISNTAAEMILSTMYDDTTNNYKTKSPVEVSMLGATVIYTVTDAYVLGDSLLKVTVNTNFRGATHQTVAYTGVLGGWVPPFIRGAWTANGNLNQTISDMYIDGRDHEMVPPYNLKPKTGVPGVSTSVPFVNTQFAEIGGTYKQVDYPMTFPENPDIIELYTWGGNFPDNPDEVLGYPKGTLKSIAMSKKGGSQYVVDPGKLVYPLKGVTYIEPKSSTEFSLELKSPPIGKFNQGILIVHRDKAVSRVKELKEKSSSDPPFVGLIITDYSFHHHLDILGAVIQISPNLELNKECKGNKDHWVYYSSQAIIEATRIAAENSGVRGNNPGTVLKSRAVLGGVGERRYSAAYWYE